MAEAVALPPSRTGRAPPPGPRLRFPHAHAPSLPLPTVRLARTRCPPGTRHLLSALGHTGGQGDPPLAKHRLEALPGRPGGAGGPARARAQSPVDRVPRSPPPGPQPGSDPVGLGSTRGPSDFAAGSAPVRTRLGPAPNFAPARPGPTLSLQAAILPRGTPGNPAESPRRSAAASPGSTGGGGARRMAGARRVSRSPRQREGWGGAGRAVGDRGNGTRPTGCAGGVRTSEPECRRGMGDGDRRGRSGWCFSGGAAGRARLTPPVR